MVAALKEHGIRVMLPARRVPRQTIARPAFCGNHIHIMRTTLALFKVLEIAYDAADELELQRGALELEDDAPADERDERQAADEDAMAALCAGDDGDDGGGPESAGAARRSAEGLNLAVRVGRLRRACELFSRVFAMHALVFSIDYPDDEPGRRAHASRVRAAAVEWARTLAACSSRTIISQYITIATEVVPRVIEEHGHRWLRCDEQWQEHLVSRFKRAFRCLNGHQTVGHFSRGGKTVARGATAAAQQLKHVAGGNLMEQGLGQEVRHVQKQRAGARAGEWAAKRGAPATDFEGHADAKEARRAGAA